MKYIPYQESYPHLEKAMKDGAIIRISRSENGLRIVRVEDENNNLISYGEHPLLCGAIDHADSDGWNSERKLKNILVFIINKAT